MSGQQVQSMEADRLAALLAHRAGAGEADWVAALRGDAAATFRGEGLPHRKLESWRYTDPTQLGRVAWQDAPARDVTTAPSALPALDPAPRHLMVFVNGRFAPSLSKVGELAAGISLFPLSARDGDDRLRAHLGQIMPDGGVPLAALNTAQWADGAVLALAEDAVLADPVEIVFLNDCGETEAVLHPRMLIVAGARSRAAVIERHIGAGGSYWANPVSEVALAPEAEICQLKLVAEAPGAFHTGLAAVRIDTGARYRSLVMAGTGRMVRTETHAALVGAGGSCRLDGIGLGDARQHIDNTTVIDHQVGACRSEQSFKNVLDGRARAVFQGLIRVAEGAGGTDARQVNRSILLSPNAHADAKPELEIHADDVKCSHGATVGALDPAALFYLRGRGIPLATARAMLIRAFLAELIGDLPAPLLTARAEAALDVWLGDEGR